MNMEHVTIKPVGTKYVKLIPDAGYVITDGHNTYDAATVRIADIDKWWAVEA